MKWALYPAFLFLSVSATTAQGVVGLLTLPQVFGDGPCHEFTPTEVPLYPTVGAAQAFGVIKVGSYWMFPDAGGCEGLAVNVHTQEGRSVNALPTEEYDYEAPAAVVLERLNEWFKLRLSDGTAWVQATEANQFYSLEALLLNGMTYIAEALGSQLFSHPAGIHAIAVANRGDALDVLEVVTVDEQMWLHVQVMSHSVCGSVYEPSVVSQGWIRAHGPSARPTVWFSSRGC